MILKRTMLFLPIVVLLFAFSSPIQAANFDVNDAASLIAAINTANSNAEADVINLTANITLGAVDNITLGENGLPLILADGGNFLTIEGNGFQISRAGTAPGFRLLYLDTGANVIINQLILNNGYLALDVGAGIYNDGNLTINDSTIRNHVAALDLGGAIYSNQNLIINNSTIHGNRSSGPGGAILSNGLLEINDSTLHSNSNDSHGGAVAVFGSPAVINRTTFYNNDASGRGGALYTQGGTLLVNNGIFYSNRASQGAAIFNRDTTIINNSLFYTNQSSAVGGAIDAAADMTINHSTIRNNIAQVGAGISVLTGNVAINNSTINNNRASVIGGGIRNQNGIITLTNSTVSGNNAVDEGGGIYLTNNTININNSTISGNTATDGGGIYEENGTLNLTNSIIAGNNASNSGDECFVFAGTFSADNNNIFGTNSNNGGCTNGANDIIPAGNLSSILSALADNGGPTQTHALVAGSPAIDSSGAGATVNDQRGASPNGTRDSGAFEYDSQPATVGFSINEPILIEAGSTTQATVTITVTNFVSTFDVSVSFSGTAANSDYTTTYAGSYTINGNGDTTFTVEIVDDLLVENPENLTLTLMVTGLAGIAAPNPQAIQLISDEAPPEPPVASDTSEPGILIFDPTISKIGFLMPGQVGVTGERLEWVVTVSNTGDVTGQNVIVTDTLPDALQIDNVNAPDGSVIVNGQTVTVVYSALQAGETVQFSIFTTVLDGVAITNIACVNADNQAGEECAIGSAISQLPATGAALFWRNYVITAIVGLLIVIAVSCVILSLRKHPAARER